MFLKTVSEEDTKLVANNNPGFGPWATVWINSKHSGHDYSGA